MTASRVGPGASHCLVCQAATPHHGDTILARALTVEASRLYATLAGTADLAQLTRRTGRES